MYSYSVSEYMPMAYMMLEQQLEECCSTGMFESSMSRDAVELSESTGCLHWQELWSTISKVMVGLS